jgi:hypothetical protein
MGKQFGVASVYGVSGTATIGGTAYVIPESAEAHHTATIDEFKSGINQLLGSYKTDERIVLDLTLVPKADTMAHAKTGLKFPAGPCKVVLTNFISVGSPLTHDINGSYIYVQGAKKSLVKGQATFHFSVFRPLDIPDSFLCAGVLKTPPTVDEYITQLVLQISA